MITGTHFTLNAEAALHIFGPEGQEVRSETLVTGVTGGFQYEFDSVGSEEGMHEVWAVDDATGTVSNTVTFEVHPPAFRWFASPNLRG